MHYRALCEHPDWGNDSTLKYYALWENMNNTQLEEGDYIDLFMQSDAVIHDSGSFILEYLIANKPCMYLQKEAWNPHFNEMNREALKCYTLGRCQEDIEKFIMDVVQNGVRYDKKTEHTEVRYYITSLKRVSAAKIGEYIRQHWDVENKLHQHWDVENNLHWCLDVSFGGDHSQKRAENAAENFSRAIHFVINSFRRYKRLINEKLSVKNMQFACAMDVEYMKKIFQPYFLYDTSPNAFALNVSLTSKPAQQVLDSVERAKQHAAMQTPPIIL